MNYKVIMYDTVADNKIELEIVAKSAFDAIDIAADKIDNPHEIELFEVHPIIAE